MDGAMSVMLRNKREAANGTVQKTPSGDLYHMMASLHTAQTNYFVVFRGMWLGIWQNNEISIGRASHKWTPDTIDFTVGHEEGNS